MKLNMIMKNWTIEDFPFKQWELTKKLPYRGKYVDNWFSNFAPSIIDIDGKRYESVENYFQACKATNESDHELIRTASISDSKKLGRKIQLMPTWELDKYNFMFKALIAKCEQYPEFLLRLDEEDEIIEWTNWGDQIWGVDVKTKMGRNALGIQLMYLRDNL